MAKKNAPRGGLRWTAEERERLKFDWGAFGIHTLAKRYGRTASSVAFVAWRMGLGPAGRGLLTLADIAGRTGYSWRKISNACRDLGIPLTRQPSGNPLRTSNKKTGLDEDDFDRIVQYLRETRGAVLVTPGRTKCGEWGGQKPPMCLRCCTSINAHNGHGLCTGCTWRRRHLELWERKAKREAPARGRKCHGQIYVRTWSNSLASSRPMTTPPLNCCASDDASSGRALTRDDAQTLCAGLNTSLTCARATVDAVAPKRRRRCAAARSADGASSTTTSASSPAASSARAPAQAASESPSADARPRSRASCAA